MNKIILTLVTLSSVVMVAMSWVGIVATIVGAAGFTIGGLLHQLHLPADRQR